MGRKRSAWDRRNDARRRRRRGRKVPTEGWVIGELSALTGMTVRRIHAFVARGLAPRAEFFGTQTRYGRSFLVRILAIARLAVIHRGQALKTALERLSSDQIEALAIEGVKPGPLARALGLPEPKPPAPTTPNLSHVAASKIVRGIRVELLPGLEIGLRDDASPLARQIAHEFIERCLGGEAT
jgi:hypothetical protein